MGTKRIRGRAHQTIAARILRRDPLCLRCLAKGFTTPSEHVDHVVPLFKDGSESDDNRQGLCEACHAEKTAEDLAYRMKGCDANGIPIDPNHPWRKQHA